MKTLRWLTVMALAIPQFMLAGDLLNDPAACQSAQAISCGVFLNNQSNDFGTNLLDTYSCLLYTSPSPRDRTRSRMPSSA